MNRIGAGRKLLHPLVLLAAQRLKLKDRSRMNSPGDQPKAPLSLAPWPQLMRAWGAWERTVRQDWRQLVAPFGLSDQQWLLLWFAGEATAPGRPQTDLADDLNVSPAQACLLLEDLRQRALMSATRCPPDRRRQYWQPTAAGRELLLACDEQLRRWQTERLAADSAASIDPICRLLATITSLPSDSSLTHGKEAA